MNNERSSVNIYIPFIALYPLAIQGIFMVCISCNSNFNYCYHTHLILVLFSYLYFIVQNRRTVINTPCTSQQQSNQQSIKRNHSTAANSSWNQRSEHKRHEIFKIICNNVDKWRDLGRCLFFRDVELSWIGSDPELRNDIKLITYRILEQAEEKFGNQFIQNLCNALAEAGRKDILRHLEKLNLI